MAVGHIEDRCRRAGCECPCLHCWPERWALCPVCGQIHPAFDAHDDCPGIMRAWAVPDAETRCRHEAAG